MNANDEFVYWSMVTTFADDNNERGSYYFRLMDRKLLA